IGGASLIGEVDRKPQRQGDGKEANHKEHTLRNPLSGQHFEEVQLIKPENIGVHRCKEEESDHKGNNHNQGYDEWGPHSWAILVNTAQIFHLVLDCNQSFASLADRTL